MERMLQCLSPVHIGTGRNLEPFDYIVDGRRYIRVRFDAVLERMTTEQATALAAWVSSQADRIGAQGRGSQDEIRREMQLLEFPGADAALREALRTDAALACYRGDRGFNRNLQVREQIKDAGEIPLIPGSSLKGALRTALAFVALGDMAQDEREALGEALWQRLGNRGPRLKERIGQVIEQTVFRCGRKKGNRTDYGDVHYDLMRVVSVSDTYDARAELIVPQIYTFVEQRVREGSARLASQAPLVAEAHAPGNTFSMRLRIDGGLLRAMARNRRPGEWIGFRRRVQRAFGPEVARMLRDRASDGRLEQAVVARIETAARRFAKAVVAAERSWEQAHGHGSTRAIREFYNRLDDLIEKGQVPLRLGWGSHFMATTLLLALKEDSGWRRVVEECFRRFGLGVPPGRSRARGSGAPRQLDLDGFPRSRRLVAAGTRPVAPLGWVALAPTADDLPGPLVAREQILPPIQERGPRPETTKRADRYGRGRPPGRSWPARRPATPLPKSRFRKPSPKPPPRKGPKPGSRVNVEILANDNAQVEVRVLDGQGEVLRFRQSYYPGQPGDRKKLKVRKVNAQGRITQVGP